jgi:hypothetical protein
MPLLPIDLQTVFSQSNQVGRDQALQQQAPPQAQAQAATEIVREAQARDTQVNESRDAGDGAEAVKDKDKGRRRLGRRGHKRAEAKAEVPSRKPVFTDPELGQNVDITG